jgi:hypothetical protein
MIKRKKEEKKKLKKKSGGRRRGVEAMQIQRNYRCYTE